MASRLYRRVFSFGNAGRIAIWAIVLGVVTAGTISLIIYRSSVDILTVQAEHIDTAIQDVLTLARLPDLADLAAVNRSTSPDIFTLFVQ